MTSTATKSTQGAAAPSFPTSESSPSKTLPPYPLLVVPAVDLKQLNDNAKTFYWGMTLIHNTFIRGLNSIHEKAGLVRPADVPAFMGYITSLTTAIHEHHHGEETIIFPFLQTKLDKMKDNLKQHERFSGGVNELENYAKRVSAKKEQYDAQKVKSLIEAFGSDIVEHLGDEIPTVAPEELAKFEKADLDAMVEVHDKHIKQQPVFTVFPFVLTHHDASAVPQWPPLPSAISWFARNIAYRVHSSYWKFSPFDNHGLPHAAYA